MSIKKIIGNLDIEIEFRSNEKNFENVKNKIFSYFNSNTISVIYLQNYYNS